MRLKGLTGVFAGLWIGLGSCPAEAASQIGEKAPPVNDSKPSARPGEKDADKRAVAAPQIGEKAPPVKVSKWMTSKPSVLPGEKDADKKVFIVEFWATWCGPCMKSIPHLAELHKKYEKD